MPERLPSLSDIGLKNVNTREYLEPDLLAKAEKSFLSIVADVIQHNDLDAWVFAADVEDTDAKRKCRQAWTELLMFCKTCLPQLPGGKKKHDLPSYIGSFTWSPG